jgi:ubiquinone/menaquinone biosynthesis C-methylase UbiE
MNRTQFYFDHLSTQWPAKYSAQGSMRPRIERFVNALARRVSSPAEVLDFGCGTGDISVACSAAGYRVCGVDQSSGMVERARLREPGRMEFETIASDEPLRIPYGESRFDAVIASSVLEYVSDPARCFDELRRVSRPGAWLLCTVPNVTHRFRKFERAVQPFARVCQPLVNRRGKTWLEYLALSMQRHPLPVWQALLRDSGWCCESVEGRESGLWLIEARAISGPRQ